MANPLKGEVSFEANGRRYIFVLGTYGLAALQRRSGMSTAAFFNRQKTEFGMDDILAIVWCGLQRHHKSITEEEASDVIDQLGQERIGEIISEGISLAFPSADGRSSRPTKLKSA